MYTIKIRRKAHKQLSAIPHQFRTQIAEKIVMLSLNHEACWLDIKRLNNHAFASYRLRVGQYRVLFNLDHELKVIAIEKIAHRKDSYQ